MIAKNLFNPVPLHVSKGDWYSEKSTYHGVCRHPIYPTGYVPAMCVSTQRGDMEWIKMMLRRVDGTEVRVMDAGFSKIALGRNIVSYLIKPTTFEDVHDEGVYYVEMDIDGERVYSEPFMWIRDVKRMIKITYRRTSAIETTENYIRFDEPYVMYIDSEIMMPEYKYNTEVEELDGVKFVRKKVSYKEHRFTFLCTDYFAEAIRMLWHCNDVVIEQHGERYKVDYMEAPQPSWNADNHLMQMDIVFQTDTIMQTNGGSVEI